MKKRMKTWAFWLVLAGVVTGGLWAMTQPQERVDMEETFSVLP